MKVLVCVILCIGSVFNASTVSFSRESGTTTTTTKYTSTIQSATTTTNIVKPSSTPQPGTTNTLPTRTSISPSGSTDSQVITNTQTDPPSRTQTRLTQRSTSSMSNPPTTVKPDVMTRYTKIPGMINPYNTLTYMSISDVISCAAECDSDDEEDFRCYSFDICAGQKLCSLSPENVTDPQLLIDSTGCDHYVRKEPKLKTYSIPDRKILDNYQRFSGMYNPYNTLTYMSISDVISCAAECDSNDEEDFRCYSFDICAGQRLCSLSSENITDRNLLINSVDCDHYSRRYEGQVITQKVIYINPTNEPSSSNTGLLVGVAIGTLIAGLLLGIISMCIYNRYKNSNSHGYELDNLNKY